MEQSHYLNQWWIIVRWTPRNKLHWNLKKKNQNIHVNKMHLKMLSAKCQLFCLGHNVLIETFSTISMKDTDCIVVLLAGDKYDLIIFNLLWPSDAVWWHKYLSTLAKIIAWCLMAPSHYLNQCWLLISEVLWHSHKSSFTASAPAAILYITNLKIILLKLP